VAVVQRKWAAMNPRAMMRDPITVDDVLGSRMVAYPLHLLECCLVTDGGGALVLTTAERAQDLDLGRKPVYVLGSGESCETTMISQMEDLTTSKAFRTSGPRAFAEAGITPADVDHLMIYDAFAHNPIYGLEDLGFVGRGEAGEFIASGNTAPGGKLPLNTNGGGLSYTHTGMYGMFAVQESIRQLRGVAPAQVDGVRIAVVHGVGGMFAAASWCSATKLPDCDRRPARSVGPAREPGAVGRRWARWRWAFGSGSLARLVAGRVGGRQRTPMEGPSRDPPRSPRQPPLCILVRCDASRTVKRDTLSVSPTRGSR
jgi:hypothetical protein